MERKNRPYVFPEGHDRETIERAPFRIKLEYILSGAFSDDFDSFIFQHTPYNVLMYAGFKDGKVYDYAFIVDEWESHYKTNMLLHALENIKGNWFRNEQEIILEKSNK